MANGSSCVKSWCLVACALVAVAAMAAGCAQPTPAVVEKEVIVERVVKETVIVERPVTVEKVVKQTVVVEKAVRVERVVETTSLLEGLAFPNTLRWRDGKLWFTEIYGSILATDLQGNLETVVDIEDSVGGYGWLPDGRLLFMSRYDRCLLRQDPEGVVLVADISSMTTHECDDMVVDAQGRAYVTHIGYDFVNQGGQPKYADIIMIQTDGTASVAASWLSFPMGMIILPGGDELIVAEINASQLTAIPIEEDGSLFGSRPWARFPLPEGANAYILPGPDGICLDAEGAVWVASEATQEVLRVLEGGVVTHRIPFSMAPSSVALGGPDGKTLFVSMAEPGTAFEEIAAKRTGRIEMIRVDVPGAGW